MPKPTLIEIAGIIGVGKTTLAHSLARELNGHLILEEYDKNPFLAQQFAGNHAADLPSELFFLLSRAGQLNQRNTARHQTVICDYLFEKSRIFASFNLNNHKLAVYNEVEKSILSYITAPQVVIYLHDTIENCLGRIAQRGRDYEMSITKDWLTRLSNAYENLIKNFNTCPTIKIDCQQHDLRNPETIKHIKTNIGNALAV